MELMKRAAWFVGSFMLGFAAGHGLVQLIKLVVE